MKNLEDACDELVLLEGDVEKVPFFMGESFITQNFEDTQVSHRWLAFLTPISVTYYFHILHLLWTILDITDSLLLLQASLDEAKTRAQSDMKEIEKKSSDIKEVMSDLRTKLYAKFGNHINLEAEDE